MTLTDVRLLDSVTQLDGEYNGVVVAASHGGVYAGYVAARAGARGVILHDAGVGKDEAGIGSLSYLAELGIPAGTVDGRTARIGDGIDLARRGRMGHINTPATDLGCSVGERTHCSAARLREGSPAAGSVPDYGQGQYLLDEGDPPVWGLDSLSLIDEDHAGSIAITASHGARLAGETTSYLGVPVAAATFNDAGYTDEAGISRLPFLDEREIPAVTVRADSARIGDARSAWKTGEVSHVNETAARAGVESGMDLSEFVSRVRTLVTDE